MSFIVCFTSILTRVLLSNSIGAGILLLLALAVIGQAAAAAVWLRRIHAESDQ
jgi:hypothetical protein